MEYEFFILNPYNFMFGWGYQEQDPEYNHRFEIFFGFVALAFIWQ